MRALLLAAVMLAFVLGTPAVAAASTSSADLQEPCGGTVALLCEHDPSTPNGTTCIVYVRGGCLMWF